MRSGEPDTPPPWPPCYGEEDVFFPTPVAAWEERSDKQAKAICSPCPYRDACFRRSLAFVQAGLQISGVFGGVNSWERQWLLAHPEEAEALAAELEKAGVDPQELRAYFEAAGPERLDAAAPTANALSNKWGYPLSAGKRWLRAHGAEPPRGGRNSPWGDAVRHVLSDGGWHPRSELIRLAAPAVPANLIDKAVDNARGHITRDEAAAAIVDRVLRASTQRRSFDKDDSGEGEPRYRLAEATAETAAAGHRSDRQI